MLILASKSPRRQELLKLIDKEFIIKTEEIIEDLDETKKIPLAIEELSYKKALAVFKNHSDDVVIGADTVVVKENEILGKPKDKKEAITMLEKLSGNLHFVITGVTILSKTASISFHEITEVTFYPLTHQEINDYIDNYNPYDKAGAYAIQDGAALFVEKIKGDYYNIMGLPVARLNRELIKIYKLLKTKY